MKGKVPTFGGNDEWIFSVAKCVNTLNKKLWSSWVLYLLGNIIPATGICISVTGIFQEYLMLGASIYPGGPQFYSSVYDDNKKIKYNMTT